MARELDKVVRMVAGAGVQMSSELRTNVILGLVCPYNDTGDYFLSTGDTHLSSYIIYLLFFSH